MECLTTRCGRSCRRDQTDSQLHWFPYRQPVEQTWLPVWCVRHSVVKYLRTWLTITTSSPTPQTFTLVFLWRHVRCSIRTHNSFDDGSFRTACLEQPAVWSAENFISATNILQHWWFFDWATALSDFFDTERHVMSRHVPSSKKGRRHVESDL